MSTLHLTEEVRVTPDRLFSHLSALWESGAALGGGGTKESPAVGARMGTGFRLPCPAGRWALPETTRVEVVEYRAPCGWRAVADSATELSWEVRIARAPHGSRLTCLLTYRPGGLFSGLRDRIRRRGRRKWALRRLLREWKEGAERENALRRLRASARDPPTGFGEGGPSRRPEPED